MTTNYAKGAVFERQMKKKLETAGWFVVRMAGSHSVADLVVIKPPSFHHFLLVGFVQCKTNGKIGVAEWNSLFNVAQHVGVSAFLAQRVKRKLTIVQLAGPKTARRQPKTWDASWMLKTSGPAASTEGPPTDGGAA